MAISIEGIKVTRIEVEHKSDGGPGVAGKYELVSNTGVVLAKQSFNGYQDIVVSPSPETARLMHALLASISHDLNSILGLV